MAKVKIKQKRSLERHTRALRRILSDRLLVIAVALAIIGLAIFQLSALYGRNQLERVPTGGGSYLLTQDNNSTAYFSAIHGETPHLVFSIKNGTEFNYVIFQYKYYPGPKGLEEYVQYQVSKGVLNSANPNVYLSTVYTDSAYFINMTAIGNTHPTVSMTAYSEFITHQGFQLPAEIAGLLIMLTGIIMVTTRLTVIFSPV